MQSIFFVQKQTKERIPMNMIIFQKTSVTHPL